LHLLAPLRLWNLLHPSVQSRQSDQRDLLRPLALWGLLGLLHPSAPLRQSDQWDPSVRSDRAGIDADCSKQVRNCKKADHSRLHDSDFD